MNREQILSVLYDLSLTIGSELELDALFRKTLQRLLFHTSFPAALVLTEPILSEAGHSALLTAAVGDYVLRERVGSRIGLAPGLLERDVALLDDPRLVRGFSFGQHYTHCLRLPVDENCCILLLALSPPVAHLPLTQIFQPLLSNLARAVILCRNNAQLTRRLAEDRDEARAELERHRQHLAVLVGERTRELLLANSRLQRTQFAMDRVGIGIETLDRGGLIIAANRAAAEMLGYEQDEMLGMHWCDLDPRLPREAFAEYLTQVCRAGFTRFDSQRRRRDGSCLPVTVNVHYQAATAGDPEVFIAFVQDISERLRVLRELEEARDAAEAATQAKSGFLASMSHEIRTPLNVVLGATHLARRAEDEGARQDALMRVEVAGKHLLSVVDEILDLSKIEAGKLELAVAPLNVAALLGEVAALLSERASEKHLCVRCEGGDGLPLLMGDVARLRQILLNFANNAIKFTERGEVVLRVRTLAEVGDSLELQLEVEDTGIGIAPEVLARLFEPFRQAAPSTYQQFGGSGLGLAISRQLARLMGGEAGGRSEPGKGSLFWIKVRLPCAGEEMQLQPAMPAGLVLEGALRERAGGRRILLAEDEPLNAEIACALLGEMGVAVDVAENGSVAVEALRKCPYALVLMDMQMPVMGGIEATSLIRQQADCAEIPILAMTANAFAEDRRACLAAGMNDFISKPVDPEQLYLALYRWLPPLAAETTAAAVHGT